MAGNEAASGPVRFIGTAATAVARDGRRKREENGEVEIPRKFALPNHSVVKDA